MQQGAWGAEGVHVQGCGGVGWGRVGWVGVRQAGLGGNEVGSCGVNCTLHARCRAIFSRPKTNPDLKGGRWGRGLKVF